MKPGGKKAASLTEHLRSSAAAKTAAEPPRKLLGGGGLLAGILQGLAEVGWGETCPVVAAPACTIWEHQVGTA